MDIKTLEDELAELKEQLRDYAEGKHTASPPDQWEEFQRVGSITDRMDVIIRELAARKI